MKHTWQWCSLCRTLMVVCGKCGNNCCNGTYGELEDGTLCQECPTAYDIQEKEWVQTDRINQTTCEVVTWEIGVDKE